MEGDKLTSRLDKKTFKETREDLEDSQDSFLSRPTILVPNIKRIAEAAEKELAKFPLETRKTLFKDIPLLSRTFSETMTRQFNLPPDKATNQAFKFEIIFTNMAKQQGYLDGSKNNHHTLDQSSLEPNNPGPPRPSWHCQGPPRPYWQYHGPPRPYWQYQGPPRPYWQYHGPPRPYWQYQGQSLPEEVWKHKSTEENSAEVFDSKEMGYWFVNSTGKNVSCNLRTANSSFPRAFSAPAGFCLVTPKYTHIHHDKEYFCTPINPNTLSSTVSTFANFRTPINYQDKDKYDPVTPLKEIEVSILEEDTIEFIHHQNGDYFMVGEGTYGSVYLAKMVEVSHLVCVKSYSEELSPASAIVHEAKLLTYLQDTGLVPEFHGILRSGLYPGDLSLVQEFCCNGITFRDLLKGSENGCSVRDRIRILYNLASGLKVLHQKEVLWNDLKANNVLVDIKNKNQVTFIDFGVASFKSGRRFYMTSDTEPFCFLAPEVRDGYVTSKASDIYSLGYLMMKSLRNQPISQNLVNLMRQCLNDDPNDRPTTQKIIKILELFV